MNVVTTGTPIRPLALLKQFADTHHSKTPDELIAKAEVLRQRASRLQNIEGLSVIPLSLTLFVVFFVVLQRVVDLRTMTEGLSTALSIGASIPIFFLSRLITKSLRRKIECLDSEADETDSEAKPYLARVDRAASVISACRNHLSELASIGELRDKAYLSLVYLQRQYLKCFDKASGDASEQLDDQESKRVAIIEAFNDFYHLHLIDGKVSRFLK